MLKKILLSVAALIVVLAATGAILYASNGAPKVAQLNPADPVVAGRPYVIKMHAKWCPVCLTSKDVWAKLEAKYAGKVNFVVFDFTNDTSWNASQAEAKRLGLEKFFDERQGHTGTIAVLEPGTKVEHALLGGGGNLEGPAGYYAAVDAVLAKR